MRTLQQTKCKECSFLFRVGTATGDDVVYEVRVVNPMSAENRRFIGLLQRLHSSTKLYCKTNLLQISDDLPSFSILKKRKIIMFLYFIFETMDYRRKGWSPWPWIWPTSIWSSDTSVDNENRIMFDDHLLATRLATSVTLLIRFYVIVLLVILSLCNNFTNDTLRINTVQFINMYLYYFLHRLVVFYIEST